MRVVARGACLGAIATLIAAPLALAGPSDVDRTFGLFGRAFPPGTGPVTSLVTFPNGAVEGVSGYSAGPGEYRGSVFRLSRDGFVDTPFRSTGSASFSAATSSGSALPLALVRQPDDGVVVLGGNPTARPRFALVRFLADGFVDPAFASNQGRIESNAVAPIALVAQSDGSFIVAVRNCPSGVCNSALIRYGANGVRDPRFGASGAVRVPFAVQSLALGRHGRPVVAGVVGDNEIALARYRGDGSPDATFGSGGTATVARPTGLVPVAGALLAQSDGKVVLAAIDTRSRTARSWLLRYRTSGSLDGGFGVRGAARVNGVGVTAIARQRNGKLVAAGTADGGRAFGLVRLRADGSRDRGFGRRGRALVDLDPGYNVDQGPFSIAVGRRQRITVGGGLGFPTLNPVVVRFRGGASSTGPTAGRARYVVRVAHARATGRQGAIHRGDTVIVRLADRRGRTQRYEICWVPPPLGRGSCSRHHRTGASVLRRRFAQAGLWTLRFRIEATGEVVLHTVRVFAPSR